MIDIRHILCPVDFSDHSRHALAHAAALARWYESTLTVLHVHPVVPLAAAASGAPAVAPYVFTPADREALLREVRQFAEVSGSADVSKEIRLAEGSVVPEILAAATKSDMLVMGTHGRSGFEHLVLGSVTEKVLRKAECPVLSVPPRAHATMADRPIFKRILCAVDFSECSLRALAYAMSLAQEADARLTVLNAIELPEDVTPEASERTQLETLELGAYVAAAIEERRARLETAVPGNVRAYCSVDTLLVKGKPHREILKSAAEGDSDLIVMGVHGRGAFDMAYFGSTTNHVVRASLCPVLTLRAA